MSQLPVFLHRSHNSSAIAVTGIPQLSGQAGALIGILDAVLVNGYNLVNVQGITRDGNVATLTFGSAHGFIPNQPILIAGCDQADYNGQFVVQTVPNSTLLTVTVANEPATPATGAAITAKAAPAGWEKAFSGTNLAVYRSTNVASTRLYLRVNDSNAQYAIITGYVSMSDVDTGQENFNGTQYWKKSATSDATSRQYFIVASDRFMHIGMAWNDNVGTNPRFDLNQAGDFLSYTVGDAFNFLVNGKTASGQSLGIGAQNLLTQYTSGDINNPGMQNVARSYNQQLNSARPIRAQSACIIGFASGADTSNYQANPSTNGLNFFPVYLYEYDANLKNSLRGKVPGLLHIPEYLPAVGVDGTSIMTNVNGLGAGTVMLFRGYHSAEARAGIDIIGGNGGAWI